MRITTLAEYGVICALHLARRVADGPVTGREIAEREQLPADYVEQILLRLRRAGIVESVRGAKGGYFLAKPPASISVRDVMAASEHQTFEMNCETHPVDADRCAPGSACAIRHVWQALQIRIDTFLGGITIADLLQEEPATAELVSLSSSSASA